MQQPTFYFPFNGKRDEFESWCVLAVKLFIFLLQVEAGCKIGSVLDKQQIHDGKKV
jgi:hypothetical protein